MKDDIVKAIANILERTGNEWATLDEIYREVEIIRGEPNANGGASIRRTIGDHCFASEHFKGGEPLFVYRGSGSGQYKLATPEAMAEIEIKKILKLIPSDVVVEFSDEPLNIRQEPESHSLERKAGNKPDYIAQEITKCKNGEENEALIFEEEYAKVKTFAGEKELAEMKQFFENKNDSEGFDILSFRMGDDGLKRIYIEVKSTTGGEETPIDISSNELAYAKGFKDDWFLYRVFNDGGARKCKIVSGRELFDRCVFVPSAYKIFLK